MSWHLTVWKRNLTDHLCVFFFCIADDGNLVQSRVLLSACNFKLQLPHLFSSQLSPCFFSFFFALLPSSAFPLLCLMSCVCQSVEVCLYLSSFLPELHQPVYNSCTIREVQVHWQRLSRKACHSSTTKTLLPCNSDGTYHITTYLLRWNFKQMISRKVVITFMHMAW